MKFFIQGLIRRSTASIKCLISNALIIYLYFTCSSANLTIFGNVNVLYQIEFVYTGTFLGAKINFIKSIYKLQCKNGRQGDCNDLQENEKRLTLTECSSVTNLQALSS